DVGDVDDIHGAVLEAAPGQVARGSVVGDEPLGARRDVRETVPHLADRRDVVRTPGVAATAGELEAVEDGTKQPLQVRERRHPMGAPEAVVERLVYHAVG